jgi:hypothetical protein
VEAVGERVDSSADLGGVAFTVKSLAAIYAGVQFKNVYYGMAGGNAPYA